MRNRIFGWIGVIWGGAVIVSAGVRLLSGDGFRGTFGFGEFCGYVGGGALFFAGVLALLPKKARG
jgi:hypothetical protein